MKVLIACEFSGVVRDAFTNRGHLAVSCDLLESVSPGKHVSGDVMKLVDDEWDLMIAHPPCTTLAVSGARWWDSRRAEQWYAIQFFMALVNAPIPRICIENPVGLMSTVYRKPDQIVQPWQFGHGETKATCLWLKDLPKLIPTNIVDGREPRIHHESPGAKDGMTRGQRRSVTYQGLADAMADQWGSL